MHGRGSDPADLAGSVRRRPRDMFSQIVIVHKVFSYTMGQIYGGIQTGIGNVPRAYRYGSMRVQRIKCSALHAYLRKVMELGWR